MAPLLVIFDDRHFGTQMPSGAIHPISWLEVDQRSQKRWALYPAMNRAAFYFRLSLIWLVIVSVFLVFVRLPRSQPLSPNAGLPRKTFHSRGTGFAIVYTLRISGLSV
jgi:hypothetical protein